MLEFVEECLFSEIGFLVASHDVGVGDGGWAGFGEVVYEVGDGWPAVFCEVFCKKSS